MSSVIAKLNVNDIRTIEEINGRINALNSLMLTLADKKHILDEKNYLYERIILDFQSTQAKYNDWWSEITKKYDIKSSDKLSVNFSTFEITSAS